MFQMFMMKQFSPLSSPEAGASAAAAGGAVVRTPSPAGEKTSFK